MEVDELQEWIESLYNRIKEQKELIEYEAYLLGKITQPWPLDVAPKAVQDLYEAQIVEHRRKEAELSKITEFDIELETVEEVLQRAKLLHEKDTGSAKSRCNTSRTKSDSIMSQKSRTASTPNMVPKRCPTKYMEYRAMSVGLAKGRAKHSVAMERHSKLLKEANPTEHKASATAVDMKSVMSDSQSLKSERIDFSNVKVSFSEVEKHLGLPTKLKRLFAMHSRLEEQMSDHWKEFECSEESNFILNLDKSHPSATGKKATRTLKALSTEEYQCLIVCMNAINALRGKKSGKHAPTSRQTEDYLACEAAQTLNIVESIYLSLWRKCQYFAKLEVVDHGNWEHFGLDVTNCKDNFLLQLPLGDLYGFIDDLPCPDFTVNYEHPKKFAAWVCERLKHQLLIAERDTMRKISDCYFRLIHKLLEPEKGDLPSSELAHAMQNAYGLLVDDKMSLSAYVISK